MEDRGTAVSFSSWLFISAFWLVIMPLTVWSIASLLARREPSTRSPAPTTAGTHSDGQHEDDDVLL